VPYAIVQHSGVTTGHTEFEQAVEAVHVTQAQANKVVKAGGLAYDDWKDADDMVDLINYPVGYSGLIPRARGTFCAMRIDGLRIYLPVRQVIG
jgi:hypothetical protein